MQNGTDMLGNSLAISYKVRNMHTIWPSSPTPRWNDNFCSHKYLYMTVHSNFSHNIQKLETIKLFLHGEVGNGKHTVGHKKNGRLVSSNMEQTTKICRNIDESPKYYAKWKKLDSTATHCMIPFIITFWIRQNCKDRKQSSGKTGANYTRAAGWNDLEWWKHFVSW